MPVPLLPVCRQRGEETAAGMYRCRSPKLAGLKLVTAETCRACYCRDHDEPGTASWQRGPDRPGSAVDDPGRIRHLLYHVYPHVGDGGSVWRWNVEQLRRRLSLFNGKRAIGIA